MNKFYIGQKIVAIKDHSQGIFKKGDEFTVLGIGKCCQPILSVNLIQNPKYTDYTRCLRCGKEHKGVYYMQFMFAPIELSTTTFEDVIKQYEPCLN